MKQKLESIVKKGKVIALAGLMYLAMGCASSKFYIEPKAGVIIPQSAEKQEYSPSFMVGLSMGFTGAPLGSKIGAGYFESSAKYIKTKSYLPEFSLKLNMTEPQAKVRPYLSSGMEILKEESKIDIPQYNVHKQVENTTAGFSAGFGITFLNSFNMEGKYLNFPNSKNVKNVLEFSAGPRITFKKNNSK